MPCALLAKKRYVGLSYETPEQEFGVLESKGIETIRRDACPFVSEVCTILQPTQTHFNVFQTMEDVLNMLFVHGLDAALKCLRSKLATINSLPLSEFVISAEYRGEYAEGAFVPAGKISRYRLEFALLKMT